MLFNHIMNDNKENYPSKRPTGPIMSGSLYTRELTGTWAVYSPTPTPLSANFMRGGPIGE